MMKYFTQSLLLILLLIPGQQLLADMIIQLDDGSSLRVEVVSLNDGIYTLKSSTLGTLTISADRIRGMVSSSGSVALPDIPASPTTSVNPAAVTEITGRLMQDTSLLSSIMALQSDPQMQEVLRDPEVMRAVQNFDLDALANHPKIKALMDNPRVRTIQGKLN